MHLRRFSQESILSSNPPVQLITLIERLSQSNSCHQWSMECVHSCCRAPQHHQAASHHSPRLSWLSVQSWSFPQPPLICAWCWAWNSCSWSSWWYTPSCWLGAAVSRCFILPLALTWSSEKISTAPTCCLDLSVLLPDGKKHLVEIICITWPCSRIWSSISWPNSWDD